MKKAARKVLSGVSAGALIIGAAFGCFKLISFEPTDSGVNGSPTVTVTLDIDFSEVLSDENYPRLDPAVKSTAALPEDGSFADDVTFSAESGTTALGVLEGYCADEGIMLDVKHGSEALGMGDYVRGIGGLSEGDCTRRSGWIYLIDGSEPDVPMSAVTMEDGQSLEVRYIVY